MWCGKVHAGSVQFITWKTTGRSFLSGSKGYINIQMFCNHSMHNRDCYEHTELIVDINMQKYISILLLHCSLKLTRAVALIN